MAAAAFVGAMAAPAASAHDRRWDAWATYPGHYYYWGPKSFYGSFYRTPRLHPACERTIVVDKPRGVFRRRVWVC
jgi:hypothetical protein